MAYHQWEHEKDNESYLRWLQNKGAQELGVFLVHEGMLQVAHTDDPDRFAVVQDVDCYVLEPQHAKALNEMLRELENAYGPL